jgi:3-oxoadipate enol-lactonase
VFSDSVPFAQLKDAQIHYDLAGPQGAPVLVFSNSLGTNFSMWDAQICKLQTDFRILRYDTRGHGQSSVTPGPYSIEQLARDVLSLLDFVQLDRVHFCGLSMGGQTGMWLALNAGNRLDKLVLSSTAAKIGTPETWNPRMEAVHTRGMKSISATVMERWFSPSYRAVHPEVVSATQAMLEATSPEGYLANCAAVRNFDARSAIHRIGVPALVISGTHDPATTLAEGRFLAEHIPGARFVELNGSHLCNIEAGDQFNSALAAFLPF